MAEGGGVENNIKGSNSHPVLIKHCVSSIVLGTVGTTDSVRQSHFFLRHNELNFKTLISGRKKNVMSN